VAWEPYVEPDNQIFPSLVIATATMAYDHEEGEEPDLTTLGDVDGLVGIKITSPKAGAKVKVTVRGNSIMETSTFSGTMDEADTEYIVFPKINYKYDVLHKMKQQLPMNLAFEVSVDGAPADEKVKTVTLRSVNDCPLVAVFPDMEEEIDMTWMIAAYVNENHPQIDEILREALDTGIANSFSGYQAEDEEDVYLQVFAIWNVMQRRGFKYSSVTETPGVSQIVFSQHVRFVDQSLRTAQANCVDGSVLFASILRKIGLNVSLVLIPGHCYLAFDLDAEGNSLSGLETTMMGVDSLKDYDHAKGISKKKAEKLKNDASWDTFSAAIEVGTQDLIDNAENFESDDQPEYMIIPVQPAREMGVMPIAYLE
jgi:hypothetical protein